MSDARSDGPTLDVRGLRVDFPVRSPWGRELGRVQAVRGVDLSVARGQTVGLVGESGCGKSTLARAVVRLVPATAGEVLVHGRDWTGLGERALRALRPNVQMVFQDPYSSLNPRMRVAQILDEPLKVHGRGNATERAERIAGLLEAVGLHPDDARKHPHEFSGGQRQRIGIARAIVLEPSLLLADEAVSALDVSVQAQILNLLLDLQAERGHAMLFISHDLRVVEQIADRVLVMYLGRIVEEGTPAEVFGAPRHPYTAALISAVPRPDPTSHRERLVLSGEPPSPQDPPSGCAFRTRCPRATETCAVNDPGLTSSGPGGAHRFACHHPLAPGAG